MWNCLTSNEYMILPPASSAWKPKFGQAAAVARRAQITKTFMLVMVLSDHRSQLLYRSTRRPLPFLLITRTLCYGLVSIASDVDSFPHTGDRGGDEHSPMGWGGVGGKVVVQMCLCNDLPWRVVAYWTNLCPDKTLYILPSKENPRDICLYKFLSCQGHVDRIWHHSLLAN